MTSALSNQPLESPAVAPYQFAEPLQEGLILGRPNRFIMDVAFAPSADTPWASFSPESAPYLRESLALGSANLEQSRRQAEQAGCAVVRCHCPAVSRIGGLDLAGRPALISTSSNPKRKFSQTVEAYSLARPEDEDHPWIGINQTASNRYVEYFLKEGALAAVAGRPAAVAREVTLGDSRLDFLVDDTTYIEVKTPLVQMQTRIPPWVLRLPQAPFSSTDRSLKHLRSLAEALKDHERAVVLYCLYYDNFGFRFYEGTTYDEVLATVDEVRAQGVELWQADFKVTQTDVALEKVYPLEQW